MIKKNMFEKKKLNINFIYIYITKSESYFLQRLKV